MIILRIFHVSYKIKKIYNNILYENKFIDLHLQIKDPGGTEQAPESNKNDL